MNRRRPPIWMLLLIPCLAALGAGPPETVDLNSAPVKEIAALPGVSEDLARKIVSWREEEEPFREPDDLRKVPGVTAKIWAGIQDRVRVLPPVDLEPGEGSSPAVGGAPVVAVANYFVEFPGIDLMQLPAEGRKAFLNTVNTEICPCGCVGDTIARCAVNDPACPVAPARLKALYEQHRTAPGSDENPGNP